MSTSPRLITKEFGEPTFAINDADAAGLAEMTFGAGYGHDGVVIVITFGTRVGTGVFVDGVLVPNTELGHVSVRGRDMEQRVMARRPGSGGSESWERWGHDVSSYLEIVEGLLWPTLFVIGGAVSRDFDRFERYLHTRTPVVTAKTGVAAGMIGAALAQFRQAHSST